MVPGWATSGAVASPEQAVSKPRVATTTRSREAASRRESLNVYVIPAHLSTTSRAFCPTVPSPPPPLGCTLSRADGAGPQCAACKHSRHLPCEVRMRNSMPPLYLPSDERSGRHGGLPRLLSLQENRGRDYTSGPRITEPNLCTP